MTRTVHLLHDAQTLARLIGVEIPCCAQVAMSTTGTATTFAAFVEGNPLSGRWIVDADAPGTRLVSWSGTLADEPFADDPRTWMRAGQERFAGFLDEVAPALLHHRRTLCFRPHHRHVLSDVHSSVKMLRDRAGGPFEVLLSPADMLAPSMLRDAEDHLARMFAHLGPVAAGVLLADVAESPETAENGLFSAVPFGQGRLPAPLVARLLADCVPPETPVILLPGDLDGQRRLLGL
ncbi:MAG: hypothetical protein ACKO3W_06030 [bacterium]